jgi:hypothetical protein
MTGSPDNKAKNPDKEKRRRPAGQIRKRGEKKYLIRIFLGRDEDTGARRTKPG